MFLGLVEMTFGLVHVYASFSLPEWQALKMTFFAPWWRTCKQARGLSGVYEDWPPNFLSPELQRYQINTRLIAISFALKTR